MVRKASIPIQGIEDIIEALQEFWELLTEEQRALLRENYTLRNHRKNDVIYVVGERPTHIYCLLRGKVKISKNGFGGRSQIVRIVNSVGYIGYRAYWANEHYSTQATAFEPSTVCSFPIEMITQMVKENGRLAFFFLSHLSVDLGVSDSRTVNLTQKHIRGRLAESLIFLHETYGVEQDGYTLSIYLSREDLANLSNMTTSNAIRTLTSFASERLIAIDGRKIKLIDEHQLRKIAHIG